MTDAGGDATTTLYLSATRNGRHPIGTLSSTAATFVNGGTTTEYATAHLGTYIDDKYAKIESTGTREYYRVRPTRLPFQHSDSDSHNDANGQQHPTGLVSSTTRYEVNGRQTTEHSVYHYRTYIDGHYAHLVSSVSKVFSDPPLVSATPVFDPVETAPIGKANYRFPKEQIRPSRPGDDQKIPTRVIGSKKYQLSKPLKLEHLLENDSKKDYSAADSENAIRARSVNLDIAPSPAEGDDAVTAIPTFTVAEDGRLNLPPPPSVEENEIEPTSVAYEERVKPTKVSLDSVTYIGFVDFTTTIDDTVVIFRPKKTYRTQTRNVLIPKIQPTATVPSQETFQPSSVVPHPALRLEPSEPTERHRTSVPEEPTPAVSSSSEVPTLTSGINPLKSLLAARASRSNLFSKSSFAPNNRPRITLKPTISPSSVNRPFFGRQPSATSQPAFAQQSRNPSPPSPSNSKAAPEPGELLGSLETDSDVELVYKTLYTTYTYFTTFFRASTTRIKSREDVISNIVTLTNILSPTDLESLRSSCQFDETCSFASTSHGGASIEATPLPSSSSRGFVGRPNSRIIEERPRTGGIFNKDVSEDENEEVTLEDDVNAILRTFYTTYTYFTTLFVDGTSSISTRTEVYSNIKSSGVPISILSPESVSILPISSSKSQEVEVTATASPSARRLEYSSIDRENALQSDLTTPEPEPETTTTEEEPPAETTTSDRFIVLGLTAEDAATESTPFDIQPTTVSLVLAEESEEEEVPPFTTEETPQLVDEDVTTTESIISDVEGIEKISVEALSASEPTPPLKTFYTTFTYFTTLYRNGTSYITSNLETVTNTANKEVAPTVVQPSVTFFTTFTYWTTSIDGDETIVTSSEETRTDILPASVTESLNILPAPSSSVEGEGIRFTERPEIISPSATLGVLVEPTTAPEIESGVVSASSTVQDITGTPSLDASKSSTDSFEDLDNEFTLISADTASSSTKDPNPSRIRTPVIRPNLFNRAQSVRSRPGRSRTTVAIITRSDVTPTLIATLASSAPLLTPTFESSSRLVSASLFNRNRSRFSSSRGFGSSSISPSSVNPSAINPSSTVKEDPLKPSIISNLRLRRPNPFRARLKERQRVQLQRLRNSSSKKEEDTPVVQAETTEEQTEQPQRSTVPIPRFPSVPGGRTPIFVSSRTENFSRRPKVVKIEPDSDSGSTPTASSPNSSRSVEVLRLQRERAKSRIQSLFKRRRPNFLRPRPTVNDQSSSTATDSSSPQEDPLEVQESRQQLQLQLQRQQRRRQKRQVSNTYYSEFGARTRHRSQHIRNRQRKLASSSSSSPASSSSSSASSKSQYKRRQPEYFETLEQPPFTAFPASYDDPNTYTSSASNLQSPNSNAYESYYDEYNAKYSSSPATSSSSNSNVRASNNVRRQVSQQQTQDTQRSRSRSRFNPNRGRTRLRSRPTSQTQRPTQPTTTARPSFSRSRFRPRTISSNSNRFGQNSDTSNRFSSNSNRFGSNSRRTTKPPRTSLFDYDDYDYYDSDPEIQSSQNGVPDSITVTHQVAVMTVIPVRENGRDEFRDILTQSPSLEVIAATALKSTEVDGKPVIFANTEVNEIAPGTKEVTYEALRATETTAIVFTPTRIRGFRTRFSHIVPSTIYNIQPVTTKVVEPVDQNQLLSQLLLTLLGPNGQKQAGLNPQLAGLAGLPPGLGAAQPVQPPPTQFITHTSTYVTTLTNTESTVLPITLRGREIKTTLVETQTSVVTATELSTETKINAGPTALPNFGFAQPQQPANPLAALPADIQQQLLAAQLQQQLRAQQQQLLNQQLLSQVNLDTPQQQAVNPAKPQQIVATQPPPPPVVPSEPPPPPPPQTSIVTKFVSGKNPGEFSVITSTVTLSPDDSRKKRSAEEEELLVVAPSPVEAPLTTESPDNLLLLDPSNHLTDLTPLNVFDDTHDILLESSFSSSLEPGSSSLSFTSTPILDGLATLLLQS